MGPKVVCTRPVLSTPYHDEVAESLGGKIVRVQCTTEEEVIDACRDADAAMGAIEPYSKRVVDQLDNCQIIAQFSVGYDQVDVEAATERGIIVVNVPDYCIEEVSETALSFILALNRKIFRLDKVTREGKWTGEALGTVFPLLNLQGQTLGLVGFGRIARALASKAQALGMKIIAHDPYILAEVARAQGAELVDLAQLLADSDFVSVHVPYTEESHHLFGLEQFKKMKSTAYFLNTGRGAVVDETALHTALTEGHIQGAAIDVMEEEPPDSRNLLFGLDNIIITPHTAAMSNTSLAELMRRPIEEVARVFRGQWPRSFVNPKVKERFIARWGKNMETSSSDE
jgi:D-3-phosphoglycerate dehydrogenase